MTQAKSDTVWQQLPGQSDAQAKKTLLAMKVAERKLPTVLCFSGSIG